jgi:aquaporin Z
VRRESVESPLSGMSMNPARTFGSAFVGHLWTGLWIYFTAPLLAMQLAAWLYLRRQGTVHCAKYHHHNNQRCIFNCRFADLLERERASREARPHPTNLNEASITK